MTTVASMDKFKKLLTSQIPGLLRYTHALTGSLSDAENLLSACLEYALLNKNRWNPEQKLSNWLYAIVHKIFVAQEPTGGKLEFRPSGRIDLPADPEDERLQILLAQLPSAQREIFLLVTLMELDYASIADICDTTSNEVMLHLHAARKAILSTREQAARGAIKHDPKPDKRNKDKVLEI